MLTDEKTSSVSFKASFFFLRTFYCYPRHKKEKKKDKDKERGRDERERSTSKKKKSKEKEKDRERKSESDKDVKVCLQTNLFLCFGRYQYFKKWFFCEDIYFYYSPWQSRLHGIMMKRNRGMTVRKTRKRRRNQQNQVPLKQKNVLWKGGLVTH